MENRTDGRRTVWFVVQGEVRADGQIGHIDIIYRTEDRARAEAVCEMFDRSPFRHPGYCYELGEF